MPIITKLLHGKPPMNGTSWVVWWLPQQIQDGIWWPYWISQNANICVN